MFASYPVSVRKRNIARMSGDAMASASDECACTCVPSTSPSTSAIRRGVGSSEARSTLVPANRSGSSNTRATNRPRSRATTAAAGYRRAEAGRAGRGGCRRGRRAGCRRSRSARRSCTRPMILAATPRSRPSSRNVAPRCSCPRRPPKRTPRGEHRNHRTRRRARRLSDLRLRAVFERRCHGEHARTPVDRRRDRRPVGDVGHGDVDASQAQRL